MPHSTKLRLSTLQRRQRHQRRSVASTNKSSSLPTLSLKGTSNSPNNRGGAQEVDIKIHIISEAWSFSWIVNLKQFINEHTSIKFKWLTSKRPIYRTFSSLLMDKSAAPSKHSRVSTTATSEKMMESHQVVKKMDSTLNMAITNLTAHKIFTTTFRNILAITQTTPKTFPEDPCSYQTHIANKTADNKKTTTKTRNSFRRRKKSR